MGNLSKSHNEKVAQSGLTPALTRACLLYCFIHLPPHFYRHGGMFMEYH